MKRGGGFSSAALGTRRKNYQVYVELLHIGKVF